MKKKEYVLVLQGMEIFRSSCEIEAKTIMEQLNREYYQYREECAERYERFADNEVFMCEEEVEVDCNDE